MFTSIYRKAPLPEDKYGDCGPHSLCYKVIIVRSVKVGSLPAGAMMSWWVLLSLYLRIVVLLATPEQLVQSLEIYQ